MNRAIWNSPFLIGSVMAVWAAGTASAFWILEARYLRPAARPRGAAIAEPDRRPAPPVPRLETTSGVVDIASAGNITVLNFWNARCACSEYAEPHVHSLMRRFGGSGVRFVTVVEGDGGSDTREDLLAAWRGRIDGAGAAVADRDGRLARLFGVWAAPGAVIVDRGGRIAYVGGYNAARFCDDPQTAWAAKALESVIQGKKPARAKTLFFGCQILAVRG